MPDPVLITPFDESNQKLVDQVHPSSWINPEPAGIYHLVVVGGGTAGLAAAADAARSGARVALVERHLLGGDRLVTGSVPALAMRRAARAWKELATAGVHGLREAAAVRDFGAAMKRMRELRAALAPQDSAWRLKELGVDVFLGHGRFVSPHELEVEGAKLAFHRALIATGGLPHVPEVPGLADAGFLTSESVFSLQQLPTRLAVVGGGPLGCELAQAFARFGAQVTLLVDGERLLPHDEPAAAEVVERALAADGVRLVTGARLTAVERGARSKLLRFTAGEQEHRLMVEEILVVTGRRPNLGDLGLDAAGIGRSERGVTVDERLQTANPAVYAAGGVSSELPSAQAADALGRLAVRNALFSGRERASDLLVPWTTFTSPEVARVGLSEQELRERGEKFETITVPLEENDRARLDGAAEGFLAVHHRRGRGEILGATLVAEHAGETIGELALAMRAGTGLGALAATIHPYPTHSEVLRRAGDLWRGKKLTPLKRKLLALRFRRLEKQALKRIAKATAAASGPTG